MNDSRRQETVPARTLQEILELLETGECPRESRPALVEILDGDDADMKLRALEFTAELIDDDEMAELHLELVESDDERTDVRARAAVALGPALELCEWGSWEAPYDRPPLSKRCFERTQKRLERLYRRAGVPKLVRRRVLEASVRAPCEWHRGVVRAAWQGGDPEWRCTAVLAMGEIGGFEELLGEALEADDERLVCQALRSAAGREGVPGAEAKLLEYARNRAVSTECRLAAIEGLRFVDSREAPRLLEELSRSSDNEVAGTAAWALDEWNVFHGTGMDDVF